MEILHFEGALINEQQQREDKEHKVIDDDLSDNIVVSFSNLHALSYPKLRIIRLIDCIIEAKFFRLSGVMSYFLRQLRILEFTKQIEELDFT